MQRATRWLTHHFHHIKWDDGEVSYSKTLVCSLIKPLKVISTKGLKKVEFLQGFHHNVIEIEENLHVNNNIKVDYTINNNYRNSALLTAEDYALEIL